MTATKPQAEPKAKPILFSGPMVRAILEGRKTQTRRALRNQPADGLSSPYTVPGAYNDDWMMLNAESHSVSIGRCPYGKPGDRLWVRETFTNHRMRLQSRAQIAYRADETLHGVKWRPSIFMPRWASRITLQIESIRVERLQEITLGDIASEGWPDAPSRREVWLSDIMELQREGFDWWINGWDALNAKRGYGWSLNPWVWIVTFTQVK